MGNWAGRGLHSPLFLVAFVTHLILDIIAEKKQNMSLGSWDVFYHQCIMFRQHSWCRYIYSNSVVQFNSEFVHKSYPIFPSLKHSFIVHFLHLISSNFFSHWKIICTVNFKCVLDSVISYSFEPIITYFSFQEKNKTYPDTFPWLNLYFGQYMTPHPYSGLTL